MALPLRGLVCLACLFAAVAAVAGDEHASLDADDGAEQDALGESLESGGNFGYFCTPSGQNNPDFAYNDKDCKVDKPQACGEVWCCASKAGVYNCPRGRRVVGAKCGMQKKPTCDGDTPTPSASGPDGKGCKDQHASLCEAAKAYGHCKLASYAAQCPRACGSCGVALSDKPSVASILAQAKALDQKNTLDKNTDAQEVAAQAMNKMHHAVEVANMASNSVAQEQEAVATAKSDLKEAESHMKDAVAKAQDAGLKEISRIEREGGQELKQAKKKEKRADRATQKDRSMDQGLHSKLRQAETARGRVGRANVEEAKAAVAEAKSQRTAAERQESGDKDKKAAQNPDLKAAANEEKKEELKSEAAAKAAKNRVSSLEDKVSDDKARLKNLRDEAADKNPATAQVIKVTNSVEKSKRAVNSDEAAESVVLQQAKNLKKEVAKDKDVVEQDKTEEAAKMKALKAKEGLDAVKLGRKDASKIKSELRRDFVDKAVLKLKEIAIENKKDSEIKDESVEEAVYTDATLQTKAEGAFMRATKKIDDIFDDVKPLLRGLDTPKHATFTSEEEDFINGGSRKGTKAGKGGTGVLQAPPPGPGDPEFGKDNDDPDIALLSKKAIKDKEAMMLAKKKLEDLKSRINDPMASGAPIPADVLAAAEAEAKAAADKAAASEGKTQGAKEAKARERMAAATMAAKEAAKVKKDEVKVGDAEDAVKEIEGRKIVVSAKVEADKEDMKDLKEDLTAAKQEEKSDTVSPAEMDSVESRTEGAEEKLLKAKAEVATAAASKKAAQAAQRSAKKELVTSNSEAQKRKEEMEKSDIKLVNKRSAAFSQAKGDLEAAKRKQEERERLSEKISRLKNDISVAQQKMSEDTKQAREEADSATGIRQKLQDKLNIARQQKTSAAKGMVDETRGREMKNVDYKRQKLEDAEKALRTAQGRAEKAGSLAGIKAKVCRQLVPGNSDSKDEASLCGEIKKEAHCNFFDYARYCAKSCGTCIL